MFPRAARSWAVRYIAVVMPPPPKNARPASKRPSTRPAPPAAGGPPCLVCGAATTRTDATLCLNCIRKGEKPKRPRFPGGARTEHGTRVARAVTCVRCGKEDYLAFKPKEAEKVMCRDCTLEVAGMDEHGDIKLAATLEITCQSCGKKAKLPRRKAEKLMDPENPEPILCGDCEAGIVTNRDNKVVTGERRKSGVILKRKTAR